jgi:hypothetical protein
MSCPFSVIQKYTVTQAVGAREKVARHHNGLSDAPTEKVTQKYYLKRHHPKSFRRRSKVL